MALSAPVVSADPTAAAEANTALSGINAFVATARNEALDGLAVLREHMRLVGGSNAAVEDLDAVIASLASFAPADPAVVTDPATLAQTNAALASMSAIVDTLNARSGISFAAVRRHMRKVGGRFRLLEELDAANVALQAPATITAPTVASDPATKAETNAALASMTSIVDTANSEILTTLQAFVDFFRLNPGNIALSARLDGAITALRTP